LRAALKLLIAPVTVIDEESFEVEPKFKPVVEAKVSVPLPTVKVIVSGPVATMSITLTEPENVCDESSVTLASFPHR
jgi:hypothetical protein